jgi:hypothetical protein
VVVARFLGKMLYSAERSSQFARPKTTFHHGKSQEEAPPQDVEAQTPEAPEGEPPQEAYVAEVKNLPVPL